MSLFSNTAFLQRFNTSITILTNIKIHQPRPTLFSWRQFVQEEVYSQYKYCLLLTIVKSWIEPVQEPDLILY